METVSALTAHLFFHVLLLFNNFFFRHTFLSSEASPVSIRGETIIFSFRSICVYIRLKVCMNFSLTISLAVLLFEILYVFFDVFAAIYFLRACITDSIVLIRTSITAFAFSSLALARAACWSVKAFSAAGKSKSSKGIHSTVFTSHDPSLFT